MIKRVGKIKNYPSFIDHETEDIQIIDVGSN